MKTTHSDGAATHELPILTLNHAGNKKLPPLFLPELPPMHIEGGKSANKMVRWVLFIFGSLLGIGIFIASWIEAPQQISAQGYILPFNTYPIRAQMSGIIRAIFVKEGQLVEKGDILLKFDDFDLREQLLSVEQQIQQATLAQTQMLRQTEVESLQQQTQNVVVSQVETEARQHFRQTAVQFGFFGNADSLLQNYTKSRYYNQHLALDEAFRKYESAQSQSQIQENLQRKQQQQQNLVHEKATLSLNILHEQKNLLLERLKRSIVYSPISGKIITDEAQEKLMNRNVHAGQDVLELDAQKGWKIETVVSNMDRVLIAENQSVRLDIPALRQLPDWDYLNGYIISVAQTPNERGYRVTIGINSTTKTKHLIAKLRNRLSVNADIQVRHESLLAWFWRSLFQQTK